MTPHQTYGGCDLTNVTYTESNGQMGYFKTDQVLTMVVCFAGLTVEQVIFACSTCPLNIHERPV